MPTTTQHYSLSKFEDSYSNWGAGVNANFDAIDQALYTVANSTAQTAPVLLTTGPAISAYTAVAVSNNLAVLADSSNTSLTAIGVAQSGTLAGALVPIQFSGSMSYNGWSWTSGAPIFVGASGSLTQTAPTAGFLQILGYAITATSLLIDIQAPIRLL